MMINKVSGNGVSRAVFECIKENRGASFDWVLSYLMDCGYKKSSVTSLISQMLAQDMVTKVDGYLYARIAAYRPLKTTRKKKPVRKAKAKAEPVLVDAELATTKVQVTAASLLETLSVLEAHALYVELRSMFGEK